MQISKIILGAFVILASFATLLDNVTGTSGYELAGVLIGFFIIAGLGFWLVVIGSSGTNPPNDRKS